MFSSPVIEGLSSRDSGSDENSGKLITCLKDDDLRLLSLAG